MNNERRRGPPSDNTADTDATGGAAAKKRGGLPTGFGLGSAHLRAARDDRRRRSGVGKLYGSTVDILGLPKCRP